jgi:hypothetical protein
MKRGKRINREGNKVTDKTDEEIKREKNKRGTK